MRRRAPLAAVVVLLGACGGPPPSPASPSLVESSPSASPDAPSPVTGTDAPTATVAGGASVPVHSVVVLDAGTLEVLDVLAVGPDPKMLGVADGQTWTLNLGDGGFSRIDVSTRTVTPVRLEGDAVGMTVDGDILWATHDQRFLTGVDGATGVPMVTMELAHEPIFELRNAGFLDVADSVAWLTVPDLERRDGPQELWAVDTRSGERVATYPLARDPLFPIVGEGAVWVPVPRSLGLVRVDLATRQLAVADLGQDYVGIAVGDGAVWAVSEFDHSVDRLAPDGTLIARIDLPWRGRGIATGPGVVYASTEIGVTMIEARTNTVLRSADLVSPLRHGFGPTALAYASGLLWVAIE